MPEPSPPAAGGGGRLRHLHPFTLVLELVRFLRNAILPLAILALGWVGGGRVAGFVLAVAAATVLTMLVAVARYLTLRYGVEGDRLVIRSGILFLQTRTIPVAKIQNIDLRRGPLQRLLQVVEIRVETAGTGQSEAHLSVVGEGDALLFREELLARRGAAPPWPPPAPELVRASTLEELLLAGATENRIGAIVAALFGLLEVFEDFGSALRAPLRRALEAALGAGPAAAAVGAAMGLFALLLAGWVVSILLTVVNFHGFTLRRSGGELRRRHGLLTRFEAVIPLRRIQVVRLEANPLRRLARCVSVRAETAGSAKDRQAGGATTLCPLLRAVEAPWFCRVVFPDLDLAGTSIRPVHRLAFRRGFLKFLAVGGILVGALAGIAGPTVLATLPVAALGAAALAGLRYRALGYALSGPFLLARAGVWTRRLWVVPLLKIQSVAVLQSPFQRRLGLATLAVDTAGAGPLRRAHVVDIAVEEAVPLLETLSRSAARGGLLAVPA